MSTEIDRLTVLFDRSYSVDAIFYLKMVVANKVPRASKVRKPSKMHRASAANDKPHDATPDNRAKGKVHLVAQELKFTKIFAGNNTSLSEKQLRKLKKWFIMRSNSSFRKYCQMIFVLMTIV